MRILVVSRVSQHGLRIGGPLSQAYLYAIIIFPIPSYHPLKRKHTPPPPDEPTVVVLAAIHPWTPLSPSMRPRVVFSLDTHSCVLLASLHG